MVEEHLSIERPSQIEPAELTSLVLLINDVYDEAEAGMWKETGVRTTETELRAMFVEEGLIIARLGGKIVGSVHVSKMEKSGEFGMLIVDPKVRKQAIGGKLVQAAEQWAKSEGFDVMRLEILTPRTWNHPTKEFIKGWYTRLGYVPQKTEAFEEMYPHLVEKLATDCDFTPWLKPLI